MNIVEMKKRRKLTAVRKTLPLLMQHIKWYILAHNLILSLKLLEICFFGAFGGEILKVWEIF